MSRLGRGIVLGLAAGLAAGCASYHPAPVPGDALLPRYNARTLADTDLRAWFGTLSVPYPAERWAPRQLALAATWLRTDRVVRLAEIRASDAAIVTAGGRPQPGLSTDVEYAFNNPQADSRWGLAIATALTLELGGKRGARIGRARAAALMTRAEVREREWRQVAEVYRAALALRTAAAASSSAGAEQALEDSVVEVARSRFESGGATRTELARIEAEALDTRAVEARARREESGAMAALRAAIGLPGPGSDLPLAEVNWPGCEPGMLNREELQRLALSRNWGVRRAAAEYQVAEGDLRVQVANANPDLTLGPGLFFDQGTGKFTLGFGLPALLLNRNRGPIGEAEARRSAAAARLEQAQERALTDLDQAIAVCARAASERGTMDSLVSDGARRVALAEAAWRRGEIGRLELLLARLGYERAASLERLEKFRESEARLGLDLAAGAWGLDGDGAWPGGTDQ